jgi:hypothetical protein
VLGEVEALFHDGTVIIDYRAKQVSIFSPANVDSLPRASAVVDGSVDVEGGMLIQFSLTTNQGQARAAMRIPRVRLPD